MKKVVSFITAGIFALSITGCSSGSVIMPDVVGMTYNEADSVLNEAGLFSYDVTDENGKDISAFVIVQGDDYIIEDQSITPGTEFDKYDSNFNMTLIASNPKQDKAAEEAASRQAERDAERKAAAEAVAAEEAENVAKWGEDYLKPDSALTAFEAYGKDIFPYGFKVHSIAGKVAEEREDDGSIMLKYKCDITNEYGTTMENVEVEAQIAGTDSSPVVTYFYVYE